MHQVDHQRDGLAAVLQNFGKRQPGQDGREHAVGRTPQSDGQTSAADDWRAEPSKAWPKLPDNPGAYGPAVSVWEDPKSRREFSPECSQGQCAHDDAAGPDPEVVRFMTPDGLDQKHDAANNRQPYPSPKSAKEPGGQQGPQTAHRVTDGFAFICGCYKCGRSIRHVIRQQGQRTKDGPKQETWADQRHQRGLEAFEAVNSEQRLALFGRGLLFSCHEYPYRPTRQISTSD